MDTSLLRAGANTVALYGEYGVGGLEYSVLDVEYEVEVPAYETAELDVCYNVQHATLTEWEPTQTPVSQWTQIVGNKFPPWHAARRRRGSNIQRILNSITGYHAEGIASEIARLRSNKFLTSIDIHEISHVFCVTAPSTRGSQDRLNLLKNGEFSLSGLARLATPWGWNDGHGASTGTISVSREASLFGSNGVSMRAEVGETTHIKQASMIQLLEGSYVTASVYYAGMATDKEEAPHELYLAVQIQFSDATTRTWKVGLKRGTNGEWASKKLSILLPRESHSITTIVGIDNRYGSEAIEVEIGGVQLKNGSEDGPWSYSKEDLQSYVVVGDKEVVVDGDLTYHRMRHTTLFPVNTFEELDRDSLPVRLSLSVYNDESAISSNRIGLRVDKDGSRFNIGWRIESDKVVPYNSDIRLDETYGSYAVADLYSDSRIDEKRYIDIDDLGVVQVCEALTVAKGLIWVVAKETFLGRTCRVIKICSPGLRWDDTNHLECLREIRVDDGSGTCSFIGFVEGSPDQMVITIDAVSQVVTLEYDDSYLSTDGLIITRTKHPGRVMAV